MHVEPGEVVAARSCRQRHQVRGVQRTQATQVEDRPQVGEERIVTRAGEDPDARVLERRHGRVRERAVVRHGPRADVGRSDHQLRADVRRLSAADLGQCVGLLHVQIGIVERRDLIRVVEERVRVRVRRLEAELVFDVRNGVTVVVDVELVEHVVAELVEVRAASSLFERIHVHDERGRIGPVRAHERVHVREVGDRVFGDGRSLSVA